MEIFECKNCKYSSSNKSHYKRHCLTSIKHLQYEEDNKYCTLCDKKYLSIQNYKYHKYNCHKRKNDKKSDKNDKSNKSDIINDKKICKKKKKDNQNKNDDKKIMNISTIELIKQNQEEIIDEIKDVKLVVNNAINKASSLIKYLMEHQQDTPPLKKINFKECLDRLRLDFKCPENKKDNYLLEKKLINEYANGTFIENLCNSILNLIKNRDKKYQSIYNTDASRYNYVVKTTDHEWNEDIAGKRFCNLIIKPLLKAINNLLCNYREKYVEIHDKQKLKDKNKCLEYLEHMKNILLFEKDIVSNKFIKPILKEISPDLRFISKELENLEKLDEIEKFRKDILNIVQNSDVDVDVDVNSNNYSDISDNSDNSDSENYV
jgi:hypothetical protein